MAPSRLHGPTYRKNLPMKPYRRSTDPYRTLYALDPRLGEAPPRTCCRHMARYLTAEPPVVVYAPSANEYFLPIVDRGQRKPSGVGIRITHCPWCGVRLPRSTRLKAAKSSLKRILD